VLRPVSTVRFVLMYGIDGSLGEGMASKVLPGIVAVGLLGLVVGCRESEPAGKKGAEALPSEEAAAGSPVAVRVADRTEVEQAIAKHRGQVVLVDFWATWCPPCKELFPHTVALHKRLAGEGLIVMSVSLDDPSMESAVREFLQAHGATFENFISRHGASPESTQAFGIKNDTLPFFKLYDRNGRLQKTLGGGTRVEAEEIERAVEELLHQESSAAATTKPPSAR